MPFRLYCGRQVQPFWVFPLSIDFLTRLSLLRLWGGDPSGGPQKISLSLLRLWGGDPSGGPQKIIHCVGCGSQSAHGHSLLAFAVGIL